MALYLPVCDEYILGITVYKVGLAVTPDSNRKLLWSQRWKSVSHISSPKSRKKAEVHSKGRNVHWWPLLGVFFLGINVHKGLAVYFLACKCTCLVYSLLTLWYQHSNTLVSIIFTAWLKLKQDPFGRRSLWLNISWAPYFIMYRYIRHTIIACVGWWVCGTSVSCSPQQCDVNILLILYTLGS